MKFKIVCCFIFIAAFFACKKKVENPATKNPIVIDSSLIKITAHQWEIYDVKSAGMSVWSFPGVIQKCMKDDSYQFYKNNNLTAYENVLKCGTEDSTVSDWQFIDGTKKVKATLFNQTDTADIILLTADKMQLALDFNGNPAEVYFRKK